MISKPNSKYTKGAAAGARRPVGQSMVEGACIIPVMILVVVFLAVLLINMSIIGTYNYRLNAIASEAARQYMAGKWWLGMERTWFNETGARGDMTELITEEVKFLELDGAKVENLHFSHHESRVDGEPVSMISVEFDVTGLKTMSYGLFPSKIKLHASGIASDAEYAQSKHGMALVHAVDPADPNKQRAFRVPILNATIGQDKPADPSTTDPWLHAGSTLGTPPIVTINVYVKNDGELSMQETGADGNTRVTETRAWNPLR